MSTITDQEYNLAQKYMLAILMYGLAEAISSLRYHDFGEGESVVVIGTNDGRLLNSMIKILDLYNLKYSIEYDLVVYSYTNDEGENVDITQKYSIRLHKDTTLSKAGICYTNKPFLLYGMCVDQLADRYVELMEENNGGRPAPYENPFYSTNLNPSAIYPNQSIKSGSCETIASVAVANNLEMQAFCYSLKKPEIYPTPVLEGLEKALKEKTVVIPQVKPVTSLGTNEPSNTNDSSFGLYAAGAVVILTILISVIATQ